MWIVKAALRNPYTVGVIAAIIFMMGFLSIESMRVDVLPIIDIPVVNVVWQYTGLSATDMENRVVFVAERGYTTSVDGISQVESRSVTGIGLIRIHFEQGADIGAAIAQITSSSMTSMRSMPPGMQPPTIIQFNASNVPVAQLTISSDTVPEEQLFDQAQNFVRMKLFTLPGLSTPAPYGGKSRQLNIDVRPELLASKGLSPQDVVNALNVSNLIIPAGTTRIGGLEYNVLMNSSPASVKQFNDLPIKSIGAQTVTLGEVANIADAFADQTNVVRINGKRATYLNILKKSSSSTLQVVDETRKELPEIQATALKGMNFSIDFDQATFVRAAIKNVISEACIAAVLVSIMVLFFLGSWRSVFIVCTSIPLAIMTSIIGLKLIGQTLNIMTLGGLALAIGMLVDDATVEVENINRNRRLQGNLDEKGPLKGDQKLDLEDSLTLAILHGASQVALPAIMSTLAICIVFSPILLLDGPAKYLFAPMALSVVFAMLASYVFSRTLVPVLGSMLLKNEDPEGPGAGAKPSRRRARGWRAMGPALAERFARMNKWRDRQFDRLRDRYGVVLNLLMEQKLTLFLALALFLVVSLALPFFVIGRDFFPTTDAGLMKLHFRARSGTRIEETEKIIARVEDRIRSIIPPKELKTINSMIGLPISYSLAFVSTDNLGAFDSEIEIALNDSHRPSEEYMQKIRADLNEKFPGSTLYFQSADVMNQVLNFGTSSILDIQIEGQKIEQDFAVANELRRKVMQIPGATDIHISQVFDYPTLKVNVDRVKASRLGLTQKDVAASMLISLSSSSLYAPSFFLNPENNVNYNVVAKVPLAKILSVDDLMRTPITATSPQATAYAGSSTLGTASATTQSASEDATTVTADQAPVEILGNLATLDTGASIDEVDHNNVQRVVDIMGGVEERDLGGVASDIKKAIADLGPLPPGVKATLRGQAEIMQTAFSRLSLGLVLAIALVYLLMVVLFQSWIDPFIILSTLPAAGVGVLWMLALTHTTINVTSLMGSIMAIGIAVSNSILLVSFANDVRLEKGLDATAAALEAGQTRLRPVMMTALAMVLGMLPTAIGLGEAGSQNAPLGRAVIGGLLVATFSTLFVVPVVYSMLRKAFPRKFEIHQRMKRDEKRFESELEALESGAHAPARST